MQNTKTVREMIFKGADRDIKNNEEQTAKDMVDQYIQDETLNKELHDLLGPQPAYWPCFHVKQPMRKLEKSFYTMKCYLGMILGSMALLMLFVMPYEGPRQFLIPLLSLFVIAQLQFAYASSRDPGYVKKSDKISFLKLNEYFETQYICPTCEVLRPQESRHCTICNKCVDRYDHHC